MMSWKAICVTSLQTAVCALIAWGASVLAANLDKFSEFQRPFDNVKLDQKAFRRTKRPTPTAGPNIDANTNIRKDLPAIPRNPARYLPVLGRFTVSSDAFPSRLGTSLFDAPTPCRASDHAIFTWEKCPWIMLVSVMS